MKPIKVLFPFSVIAQLIPSLQMSFCSIIFISSIASFKFLHKGLGIYFITFALLRKAKISCTSAVVICLNTKRCDSRFLNGKKEKNKVIINAVADKRGDDDARGY